MAATREPDSVDDISATIGQIVRLSVSRSAFAGQAATAETELTQPSYALLRVVIDEGPLPMGRLAGLAHMDVGMATRRVKAFIEAGLVTRCADPNDGRIALVEATVEGERGAAALQDVRRNHLERALSSWSADELEEFGRLLTKFLADIKQTPVGGE